MKKFLSAMALAAAGLTAQTTVQAAAEDWKDDPTVMFNEVTQESCTKAADGKQDTMTMQVEVIVIKDSWDRAIAGKTPAQQAALKQKVLDVALKALNTELRPRIADFTKGEIVEAYDKDREDYANDPYRRSTGKAFQAAQNAVFTEVGIETMVGVDAYPTFTPGCKLQ